MWVGIIIVASLASAALGYVLGKSFIDKGLKKRKDEVSKILDDARKDAENLKRKAELDNQEILYKLRVNFENQTRGKRRELEDLEKRLIHREENLEKRVEFLQKKEQELGQRTKEIEVLNQDLEKKSHELNIVLAEEKQKLQKISSLSIEEARELLMKRLEDDLVKEKAERLKRFEEVLREEEDAKAQEMLSLAIQRCAVDHTQEMTVSVVSLPNEDMKGRVIGREGRNIRTFEMLTGVDVIIDDTPEAVTLSGFDPIRREVAKRSLEKLVSDGRIHPARIEETVEKVKQEFEKDLIAEGKNAAFDLDIHNLHPELIKLLGKLRYRTSFGQNALQHSKEMAFIMSVLASELGLDPRLAKRIGLLHDIGKGVDQQVEGTHAQIGRDIAAKYGEKDIVVNAIGAHHEEEEPASLYAVMALVGDAVSASRPGARRETLETYLKRLTSLENIANSFKGVEKSFAIQAGREIRVIVQPQSVDDGQTIVLARDLKKKVEEEMDYPGQIKITIIRETRVVEYAK
ncbi:MAG: ribonuclease Y [Candidatus Omnitrophica bacterium]|nr:ribonuclease Y [Candidatus Omnitrophota bacterium]